MFKSKTSFWTAVSLLTITFLYLLSPILSPFLIAALLAYLLDPITDRLEVKGLSRTFSVAVVFGIGFVIIILFFLLIIPILETQIRHLLDVLPGYMTWGVTMLGPILEKNFNVDLSVLEVDRFKNIITSNWRSTGGVVKTTLQAISKSGFVVLEWLANLALIPLIGFYLLRDWDRLIYYLESLLPLSIEPTITKLSVESDQVLSAFLRGQLSVMISLSIIYAVGLSMVGLDFGILIGIIAGLVSFVPYLGVIIGVLLASLAVIFQTQNITDLLGVFAVFGFGQVVESFILTPILVGDKIGLHPVTVIFAIMAGGELFGFVGVLLALPVTAVLAVVLRHLLQNYKKSQLYQSTDTTI
jgi:predicted PurR-regulated permease PerM